MTIIKKLFITLLGFVAMTANAQEGTWSGSLDVQGMKLPLVFHFAEDGCTIDSPAQGAKGIKAEKSYTPEGKIRVSLPSIGAVFEGIMVKKTITGMFMQLGQLLPLTLKPGGVTVNRPQTPVGPFPYTTEEVTFSNGDVVLNGTLTLPQNCTKNTPVVLMVTGSGQQNRDEELLEHRPFAVIADAFARQGIASLRYDDRGYDDPQFTFLQFTTHHFKQDAQAGIDMLRKRFRKVGVVGHSEGGTIALMLASEGKTDFIVSLAGMAVSGKETLLMQNRKIMSAEGVSDDLVNTYCDAYGKGIEQILKGKSANDVALPEMPDNLKTNLQMAFKQCETPYLQHLLTLDVRGSLHKVKCPVLALNGTKDMQVDCTTNLDAIDKGLTASHKVVPIEGVNHLFQHCQTGAPTEYSQIDETFAPEAIDCMIEWIKSQR